MRRAWLALALIAAPAPAAETLTGTVAHVIDGDTLVVRDAGGRSHRVHLAGIDAPEAKQSFGIRSARSLASLCYRKEAKVEWEEKKERSPSARVTCEGKDPSAEQVRRGMAWLAPKETTPGSALYEAEAYARLRQLGLWADEKPVPPWEWRASPANGRDR